MSTFQRIALALGAALFLVLTGLAGRNLYRAPRWDVETDWDGKQWVVLQAAAPLQSGDVLTAVNGRPMGKLSLLVDNMYIGSREELFAWFAEKSETAKLFEGSSVEVSTLRGGRPQTHTVSLSRDSWSLLRNSALAHWPVALVFFLVGWTTYLRPRAGEQALWFYLMCLSMSLVYLTNATNLMARPVFSDGMSRLFNLVNTTNFVLAPTLLFHFSLLLPRRRSQPWYGGLLALAYLCSGYVILTLSIPGQGVVVPTLFLGSLLAIAQGAWSYRGIIERQQMKWVGVGFLLGVGPWFVINGLPLMITGHRLMTDTLPGACLAFIPIFMAVAVHRYRLFDVGTFLEGTLAYLATVSILALIELTVLTALGAELFVSEASLLSLALLLGLYGPLRARFGYAIARVFHRAESSDEEILQDLADRVASDATPEGVGHALGQVVERFWAPSGISASQAADRPPGAYLQLQDPPTVELVYSPLQAVVCGPLPQGRHYTSRVLRQLQLLARQTWLYHQSAVFFLRADSERQKRLEERERLLGDLHDGVGSALASIRMLSQEDKIGDLARDALFELQNVLYDSPDYQVQRQQFVAELRTYCRRIFDEHDIEFSFVAQGQIQGELSRTTALSLFRLIKEGLTNSMKHSGCQNISLMLDFSKELVLNLSDDGTGLSGDSPGRGLTGMRTRVESLGGELSLRSENGVHLEVRLPL